MDNNLLNMLEQWYKKCSDCGLHPEYRALLDQLFDYELTQELIDYLCMQATSKKHIWEIKFDHLRILLLNKSALDFDLKSFYLDAVKKSRRYALKLFLIRGYALYATENELIPIMDKFRASLEKYHGYLDYEYILSVAGLPYLAETYGYDCFLQTLRTAEEEYQKIDPLLRGYFTIDQNLDFVHLLPTDEVTRRLRAFTEKLGH